MRPMVGLNHAVVLAEKRAKRHEIELKEIKEQLKTLSEDEGRALRKALKAEKGDPTFALLEYERTERLYLDATRVSDDCDKRVLACACAMRA